MSNPKITKALIQHLSTLVSENRFAKFNSVIENRTKHITLVMEDIFQSQNASAVVRTSDIFGIQDIHVIENKNEYVLDTYRDVSKGSSKWVDINRYNETENNTLACMKTLKAKGYRIVATSPHTERSINDLSITEPTALVFGTELTGISDIVKENADELVRIPMFGFTESFNISVSAAICLNVLTQKLHSSSLDWKLKEEEHDKILLNWLRTTVRNHEAIEADFIANMTK